MKDCFGLHGHSAFGYVANKISGVGRKAATSGGLTTDLIYWLQAGKTVDILRCAAKSTDLLPPSALPRLLRSLRLTQPTRPAGCRLPADAGHRAAVVVLRIYRGGSADVKDGLQSGRQCGYGRYPAIRVSLLYGEKTELLIAIYGIGAIGDLETFDDYRLTAKFCVSGMRRSAQALRCRALTSGYSGIKVRREESGQLRSKSRHKGVISTLLGLLCSSMSAQPPPKSRDKWNKVCETDFGRASSDSHPICPQPRRGDKRPGTSLRFNVSAVRRTINIIYRDCITGRLTPPVFASHTI